MGQQQSQSIFTNHTCTKIGHCMTLLTPPSSKEPKHLMRTHQVGSDREMKLWRSYLKRHREGLEASQELTRLVQVLEEEQGILCGGGSKVHLVYEYGSRGIDDLIQQRRQSGGPYFNYQDVCNILYSCLSALWWAKKSSVGCPQPHLARHQTIFISTRHMLLMDKGTLKIMDPLLHHFNERYIRSPSAYYSPQKLSDFTMVDDQKCAIFELGLTLLEICLLEPLNQLYYKDSFLSDVAVGKLNQAQEQYGLLDQRQSIFELIRRMTEVDRSSRISLDEAILFAQDMYESSEASLRSSQNQSPTKKSSVKPLKDQERTRDSSAGKSKRGKFHRVRDWMVSERNDESPSVANFTIEEASRERQQSSSLLESLTVNHPSYDLTHSQLHTGVFKNVSLAASYQYHTNPSNEDDIFTPPALMNLINQQLQDIKIKAADRKKRRSSLISAQNPLKINNQVYIEND